MLLMLGVLGVAELELHGWPQSKGLVLCCPGPPEAIARSFSLRIAAGRLPKEPRIAAVLTAPRATALLSSTKSEN